MPNMPDEREIIDGLLEDAEAAIGRGATGKALALYQGILRLAPRHVGALRQLAAMEINGGDPVMAMELFERARQIEPLDPDLCHGLATALRLMGHSKEARLALKAALKIDPNHGPSLYDTALMEQQTGNHALAGELYLRLAAQGARFDAMFNRGVALYRTGNLLAAERWFHAAGQIDPTSAKPLINLGMIYRRWGFVKEAIACQEQAIKFAPDNAEAHWNLANALLLAGDFQRGFAEYEWRFRRPGRTERPSGLELALPRWKGETLSGKTLLLTLEQGLGDAIQFVRFAGLLNARGVRVVLEAMPPVQKLLATAPGVTQVVPPGQSAAADYYLPLMSLPHVLGTTLETIPNAVPYLSVTNKASYPQISGTGLRVGLVWRGNPQHENDRQRSLPLEMLTPLLDVPDVSFYSLQVGVGSEETGTVQWSARVLDLAPGLTDFTKTAQAVNALDLVISVDTAVAHLAGALAKPVWVLIPLGNDWRWLHERSDSPWYPTMRLYRQGRARKWGRAIEAMKRDLAVLAAERKHVTRS